MQVKPLKITAFAGLLAVGAALGLGARSEAQTLHVLRPINSAIVRETVPVRIAPGDLPSEGYVGISVDGEFRTARVLPDNKHDPVYDWDTKAPYASADAPNTQKFIADGPHTLTVKLYDTSGKSLGEQSITLKVANKISVPTQGIKLSYRWRPDLQQRYTRRTEADTVADGAVGANQTLQTSIIRFTRTVEDTTGGDYLIRDRILPGGILINHGQAQFVDALYNIKSKYRTVDTRGDILGSMAPLSLGDHFGFSIPVLSARRVAVGDTWQAPVEMSLDWASTKPATVNAESRLEGFEWQGGYPAAKIRETYSGPVTFTPANSLGALHGGAPAGLGGATGGLGSASNGTITLPTVNYERIVYFAYNSGRLVRTETTLTLTLDSTQMASLGFSGTATAVVPSYAPASGSYPVPGGGEDGIPPMPIGGPPPGYVPGGYNPNQGGGQQGGYGVPATPQSTTTNLKVTDITSQI